MPYRISIAVDKLATLKRKIKFLADVFDMLPEHIIITDENANVIYANKAAEEQTGRSATEIIGKTPGDLWGGQMPKEFYEKMWHTIKIEKKPFVGDVKNKRSDGTKYWQELNVFPVLDKKGNIEIFIGVEPKITIKASDYNVVKKINGFMFTRELTMKTLKEGLEELKSELKLK